MLPKCLLIEAANKTKFELFIRDQKIEIKTRALAHGNNNLIPIDVGRRWNPLDVALTVINCRLFLSQNQPQIPLKYECDISFIAPRARRSTPTRSLTASEANCAVVVRNDVELSFTPFSRRFARRKSNKHLFFLYLGKSTVRTKIERNCLFDTIPCMGLMRRRRKSNGKQPGHSNKRRQRKSNPNQTFNLIGLQPNSVLHQCEERFTVGSMEKLFRVWSANAVAVFVDTRWWVLWEPEHE